MKKKNFWKIIALMLSFMLVLAACSTPEPETPAEEEPAVEESSSDAGDADNEEVMEDEPAEEEAAAPSDDKAAIEIWIDSDASCMVETVVDAFNAQSDTISVEAVVTENPWDATRTAMAGGAGPDIVRSPGPSFVFELVQAGQVLPLDEMASTYGWADSFAPFALSLGSVDGKLYSLPDEMETLVLYYNKTLFEDNGWAVPTTIDELHVVSAEIADAGFIPFGHGNTEWRPANEWFVGEYLNHVAGPDMVYQALTDQVEWTDPAFVEAIEMLNEAQQNGWYMGGLEFYYTTTFDDLHTSLAVGESAMNVEGTWAASSLNDTFFIPDVTDNEWDWVAFPSRSGDAIFDLGMGNTSSVNANTDYPAESAEFLNYWFSPEVVADRFATCGIAPAPVVIPEGTITGIDERIAAIFESLSASAAAGDYGYTTWTFFPPKTDVYIYEEIEKVWSGDITATEYMEGLNTLFQEEFDAGEIPPIPER